MSHHRSGEMRRFWDSRAREDAFYFVDSRLEYGNPDEARFWRGGELDLDKLLDALGASVGPSDVVADIGCGVGRLTRPIAARASRVFALDISAEMLQRARALNSHLQNVEWLLGSGTDLQPIPDRSLDGCISHVVFQHIPDAQITFGYVREMGRVLAPEAWSAFQVSNDPEVHRPRDPRGVRALTAKLLRRAPKGRRNPAWLGSMIDLDELAAVADQAGMDVEQVVNAGTQMCVVLLRRRATSQD